MARLRSGILGNLRGKVAGVVASQWKDKNYLREYVKPANPNTASQQVQRTKMSDAVAFAKTLVGPVFNAYTDRFQKAMSGFNRFIKTNIAIFDGTPDYPTIVLTEGVLFPIDATEASYVTGVPSLTISWTGALGNNGADDDAVYGAAYDKGTGLWYFPAAETTRDADVLAYTVPAGLTPTDLQCYVWAIQDQTGTITAISASVHEQAVDGS